LLFAGVNTTAVGAFTSSNAATPVTFCRPPPPPAAPALPAASSVDTRALVLRPDLMASAGGAGESLDALAALKGGMEPVCLSLDFRPMGLHSTLGCNLVLAMLGYSVCSHQVVCHRLTGAFLRCNHIVVPQVHGVNGHFWVKFE
jgi:hypothetical protein